MNKKMVNRIIIYVAGLLVLALGIILNILLLHLPLTFYMPPLYFLTRHIVPCYCLILVVYLLCFVTINNYLLQYSIFLEQAIASAPGPIWHETESESGFMTISLFGNAA